MENVIVTHYDTKEYVYPININTLLIKIKCKTDRKCSVNIVYWNRFKEDKRECELESFCINGSSEYFSIKLSFDESAKYLRYYFIIKEQEKISYYSPYGLTSYIPKKYFEYQSTNANDIFTVPKWAMGTVGYQIFPERFFNGDFENDPADTEKWNELPNRINFFGGDLRGIINKFAHIKDLGINAIYLTPIFHSPSNHKYDTIDYFKIDPSFGNMEDLQELVRLCHNNDIKIVLDGVFNHIGYYSHQFQDAKTNGKLSKYWDWFYINGEEVDTDAINYECVGYYKWMPKLKYSNEEVREYFLRVGEYWIKEADIDGWRLDVADEVDFTFWQEFRRKIKGIDRNIILIGETWKNGIDLLRGDQMDTIMNYRFRDAVIDYFVERNLDRRSLADRIDGILFDYPFPTHNILYNLLDSHDTARFLTTCNGNLNMLKLAVVFQMLFPGMPFIYYGGEIGMTGDTDPDCRRTMKWDSMNNEILEFYKSIIKIRRDSNALKYGTFKHIDTKSEVYGFIREHEDEAIIVLINNSDKEYRLLLDLTKYNENKKLEILSENSESYNSIKLNKNLNSIEKVREFKVDISANYFEIINLVKEEGGVTLKSLPMK